MLHSYPFYAVPCEWCVDINVVDCIMWGKTASSDFAIIKKIRDWKINWRLIIKNGFAACWGAWKKKTGANKKKQLCLVLDMVCGFLWEGFQEAAERCVWCSLIFTMPVVLVPSELAFFFLLGSSFCLCSVVGLIQYQLLLLLLLSCVLVPTQLTFFKFLNAGCNKFVAFKMLDVNSSW